MRYCHNCVMPDTKPFIAFDEHGVCNACQAHTKKQAYLNGINWIEQKKKFEVILERAKAKRAPFYDVVVPVSGGKDSIYQVHTALSYGLRVLAVNVDYGIKTEIGIKNLNVIPDMGASLIVYSPEQKYHNQMIKIGFEDFGDPDLMSHALLYAYPIWCAAGHDVPFVIWGENSAFEYGGDKISGQKTHIDRDWFYKYVVTKGITIDYIYKKYGIPRDVLKPYSFPQKEIDAQDIEAIFLSCFFHWDSQKHLELARTYGFSSLQGAREGTFRNYVGIDEKINRIHQYMKVLKFGYGRASDHACEEIRNGRMSRDEAVKLVKEYDVMPLSEDYVDDFCELLGYSTVDFWSVMKRYCNHDICRLNDDKSITVLGHEHFLEVQ